VKLKLVMGSVRSVYSRLDLAPAGINFFIKSFYCCRCCIQLKVVMSDM